MTLLDPQMQAFIAQTLQHYPVHGAVTNVIQQRQCYRDMYRSFSAPKPTRVQIKDEQVKGPDGHLIPIRHYRPQGISSPKMLSYPVQVVYLHGGGFVVGDLDSHDDLCAEMANICGFNLVSVAYRLAPEHQYPCDISDCLALVDHLLYLGKAIIRVVDSACSTLAASVYNPRASYTGTLVLVQLLIFLSFARV